MSSHGFEAAAADLRKAYREGPIAPMRNVLEPGNGDDAYRVQEINTRLWEAEGRRIVGRKIGLTAKAVQVQLGVDQPDYGVLFDDMQIANGGELRASRVLQPKAEAEIALVMARDVNDPSIDARGLAAAVAFAAPAIEIVDSRIADWKITFADTVADNGSSAFFVLGDERRPLDDLDLYTCGMVLEVNGEISSLGAGAACLGHPFNAAAWLAQTLAERGEPLREGDVLLTGALGPMVAIKPGDQVRTAIGGIGSCGFTFIEDRK
ncbi:2-keto-4-pentenoate hydratase [Novosphingobium sp.]|uniref:2-keto-4-pentenoate hydratase n=1 Tax=Novosphingobium sp. TaxID=1874826 RepID=UPI002FDB881D